MVVEVERGRISDPFRECKGETRKQRCHVQRGLRSSRPTGARE